ncbi:MAG: ArsC/Spx/MgsR family protein [Candidatus Zixiibacteriota bacterium]
MALKRATLFTYGSDERSEETRRFIEDGGVIVDVRDLALKPLTLDEVEKLIGNLEIQHFINPLSESFEKLNLDDKRINRGEVLKAMAGDNTLLRRPIIKSTRLVAVGHDKRKIAEMLQLKPNGSGDSDSRNDDQPPRNR